MRTVHSEFFGPIPVVDREVTLEEAEGLAGRRLDCLHRYAVGGGRVFRRVFLRELCGGCRGKGCRECRNRGVIEVEFYVRID